MGGGNGDYSAFGGGIPSGERGGSFSVNTSDNGSFNTFCVELNEMFSFNTPYNYSISGAAVNGGVGGGNPDPLDTRTAFLYYHFALGDLGTAVAGWSADGVGIDALQYAIWFLEDEVSPNGGPTGLAGTLVAAANAATAVGGSWYNAFGNTTGNVRIMNVYSGADPASGPSQDQLVLIPALPAATLGMIGVGLVVGLRRWLPSMA